MAAPVRFGQIVWADMADANGIRKLRPAVVVTPSDRLPESGPFEVVAVTSQVPEPLPPIMSCCHGTHKASANGPQP